MLQMLFEAWERRLAAATTDRVVRPFDWGLEWIPRNGHHPESPAIGAAERVGRWVDNVMSDTDAFFTPEPTTHYVCRSDAAGDVLLFPSALRTPHVENNTVRCGYFRARTAGANGRSRAAVIVLPQWNADEGGHVGLCRLLAWNGLSALRMSLPYHDQRMPP